MARRPALIKRKAKVVRKTRSEAYIINKKHMGDEPVFTKPLSETEYIGALNWYNYMAETGDSKEYVIDYLTNLGKVVEAKKVKALSDSQIPNTLAWTLRMLSKGYELPASTKDYVKDKLNELLARAKEQKEVDDKKETVPVVSIQDRMRERAHDIMGEIEGLIDDYIHKDEAFSLYDWLKTNDIPAVYANTITAKLAPVLSELIEAVEGKMNNSKKDIEDTTRKPSETSYRFMIGYARMCLDMQESLRRQEHHANQESSRSRRSSNRLSTKKKIVRSKLRQLTLRRSLARKNFGRSILSIRLSRYFGRLTEEVLMLRGLRSLSTVKRHPLRYELVGNRRRSLKRHNLLEKSFYERLIKNSSIMRRYSRVLTKTLSY